MANSKEKLNSYAFSSREGFNAVLLRLRYKEISKYFKGESCLELGCSDGEGTKALLAKFKKIVAVDGSERSIKRAKEFIKSRKVSFVVSLFEELDLDEKFDTVILAHILEHVDNPQIVLEAAKKYVKAGGVIIVDVPNAFSIHRQAGALMKMIKEEHSLNEADLSIGHQRVYDWKLFKDEVKKAGLKIIAEGGLFLKPFSNAQMAKMLDEKGIKAFNELGKRHPDIASEIYLICKIPQWKKIFP